MLPLRNKTPKRRIILTEVSHWKFHKPNLRVDFNCRCGYCDSFDGFRHTYYQVDHFIPKIFFKQFGNIGLNQYSNLVYTCFFCNNNKSSKWPSNNESIFHNGKEGFIDPCGDEYDTHFYRTTEGAIMWATELGRWMYKEAFKFDERERGIKLLWNLEKLRLLIIDLSVELNKMQEGSVEFIELDNKMKNYSYTYFQYHNELIEFYG